MKKLLICVFLGLACLALAGCDSEIPEKITFELDGDADVNVGGDIDTGDNNKEGPIENLTTDHTIPPSNLSDRPLFSGMGPRAFDANGKYLGRLIVHDLAMRHMVLFKNGVLYTISNTGKFKHYSDKNLFKTNDFKFYWAHVNFVTESFNRLLSVCYTDMSNCHSDPNRWHLFKTESVHLNNDVVCSYLNSNTPVDYELQSNGNWRGRSAPLVPGHKAVKLVRLSQTEKEEFMDITGPVKIVY